MFIRNIKRFKRLLIIVKIFIYFKPSRLKRFLKLKGLFKLKRLLFLIFFIIFINIDNILGVILIKDNNLKEY